MEAALSQFDWTLPYWDPAQDGDIRTRQGLSDGVPYEAMVMWGDGGWTRVVGINVGPATVLNRLSASMADTATGRLRTGITAMDAIPSGSAGRIESMVERWRANLEVSQRAAMVFRAIDDGALATGELPRTLAGQPFDVIRKDGDEIDQVGIAAGLYRVFAELGRRSATEDVATALRIGRATAGRRIALARGRGILPPARPGTITGKSR